MNLQVGSNHLYKSKEIRYRSCTSQLQHWLIVVSLSEPHTIKKFHWIYKQKIDIKPWKFLCAIKVLCSIQNVLYIMVIGLSSVSWKACD